MNTAVSVNNYIEQGLQAHQSGNLQEAENLYHKALEIDEKNADAYHLLGMLALDIQNLDVARELVLHAISLNDGVPIYYNNLGSIFNQLQQYDTAQECFEKAILLKDRYPEAHFNLANTMVQRELFEEAIDEYKRAIELDNSFTAAHVNLAALYASRDSFDNAMILFSKALDLQPDNPVVRQELAATLVNKGLLEKHQNHTQDAMQYFERACLIDTSNSDAFLALAECQLAFGLTGLAKQTYLEGAQGNPVCADFYYNLAVLNKQENNLDEAIGRFQQAIAVDPEHLDAHFNLGNSFKELGKWDDALNQYEETLRREPEYWPALVNQGVVLQGLGRFEESLQSLTKAESLHADDYQIHNNLGMTLQSLNRVEEALQHYDRAISLNSENDEAKWNKALALLLKGDYEQGWALYEKRWQLNAKLHNKKPDFSQPQWQGEALDGKRILLTCEQGLGDSIQFVRYASLLKAKGATEVTVICQNGLEELFATLENVDKVLVDGQVTPAFDVYCPMMSLPTFFQTTLDSVPADVPYLYADSALVEDWSDRIRTASGFRVGIVWAGNPRKEDLANNLIDSRRSFKLKDFKPVSQVKGVKLISLQKGESSIQSIIENDGIDVLDQTHALSNFADTAALIENLDLVISVDTSVAHLAGALNKSVWLLSRYDSCWRWLTEREDSPWYPSMRIFRQKQAGDWKEVMQRVADELGKMIR